MKKGQILLITLIVLSIVGIITVSVVILVQRDTQQVSATENYEEAYNASEGYLNELLNRYSDRLKPLEDLLRDYGEGGVLPPRGGIEVDTGNPREGTQSTDNTTTDVGDSSLTAESLLCNPSASGGYLCQVESDEFSRLNLKTEITVDELNYLKDYLLYKDRTVDLTLGSYNDEVTLSWNHNSAIEFTLVYTDSAGRLQSVKDIYDPFNSFYKDKGTYDHLLDQLSIHPIDFLPVSGMDSHYSVKFILRNVRDINGAPVGTNLRYLRITNRTADNNEGILLNFNATGAGAGNFPKQVREFNARSFNPIDLVTPIAKLKTVVPLNAQPESLFDYAVITRDEINF